MSMKIRLALRSTRKLLYGLKKCLFFYFLQGSHRLEKYLNIQACHEKSLNIKFS